MYMYYITQVGPFSVRMTIDPSLWHKMMWHHPGVWIDPRKK
ncbi:hypothetical protein HanXRQr2_Chr06g0276391 [Helianthus annuus]|uniref:Uncharacterized protein n=1 Tax=Helianthus annuus TaxID=4232 RepID=A0A9K3IW30_HELAN|nr:hypothetical protein HanXRQr2_Chr06g0276391 [Helianthus annuus]KAJ0916912.1 hypothetical protein HanPSC8_Chr06g0267251 [Helianthus annuus]